jgi:hypothetical protein
MYTIISVRRRQKVKNRIDEFLYLLASKNRVNTFKQHPVSMPPCSMRKDYPYVGYDSG